MNGFTNTILSLILGWLRVFISNLWKLLTSPDGGTMYDFLSAHWKAIALILCVGGFVVDRVVYFLRWRPDYVWASRRAQKRKKRMERNGEAEPERESADERDVPYRPQLTNEPPLAAPIVPQPTQVGRPVVRPPIRPQAAPQNVYAPPAQASQPAAQSLYRSRGELPAAPAFAYGNSFSQATANYAPIARPAPQTRAPAYQPYQPPQNLEPVFDDELPSWEEGDTRVRPVGGQGLKHNPAKGMVNSFGNAMPEPVAYLRDMQAGFAPQLPPERIYRPNEPSAQPAGSVHPGLQSDAFRQNFGLNDDLDAQTFGDEVVDEPLEDMEPTDAQPSFTPYSRAFGASDAAKAKPNPFAAIAKRARDLVGVEDDAHKPTIRDLQTTVDVRSAFHDPVYPQRKNGEQDGES